MLRSFWGLDAPGGIDDPERILQSHQYIEQGNHLSQNSIDKDTDPMEGMSLDLTTLPGPSSSIYDDSIRSTSVSSLPQRGSAGKGEFWSAANSAGLYHQPYDDNTDNQRCEERRTDGSLQTEKSDAIAPLTHIAAADGSKLALTEFAAPPSSLQVEKSQTQHGEVESIRQAPSRRKHNGDHLGRTDDMSHRPKERAGQRETQYRVKKHQHQSQSMKAKQQKESIIKAMQNHDGATRQTASQVKLVVRSEREPTDMEDAQVGEVDRYDVAQSCEEADPINTPPPYEHFVSQEAQSDEEGYVTSCSGLPMPRPERDFNSQPEHAHNLSNDNMERNELYPTEQSESTPRTQKKKLTHQQVRDEALQRRKGKMKVRSQLVREHRWGEGLALDMHEHGTQVLHDQTQQGDIEQHAQRDIDQWTHSRSLLNKGHCLKFEFASLS